MTKCVLLLHTNLHKHKAHPAAALGLFKVVQLSQDYFEYNLYLNITLYSLQNLTFSSYF